MSLAYVLRRLGVFFVIVWAAATINFVVPRLAPGDPVQAMLGTLEAQGGKVEDSAKLIQAYLAQFGLDEPILVQYVKYLASMARLDMGYSLAQFPARVIDIIKGGLPYTIAL